MCSPIHSHPFQGQVPSVGSGKSFSGKTFVCVSLSAHLGMDISCGKKMKYSETNVPSRKKTGMKLLGAAATNSLGSCGKVRKFPLCLAENGDTVG